MIIYVAFQFCGREPRLAGRSNADVLYRFFVVFTEKLTTTAWYCQRQTKEHHHNLGVMGIDGYARIQ
jgi:hypothetical protein